MHPRVFLDFSVNNEPLGRVIFELFPEEAPRACENFRSLCTGEKGLSATGNPLYYKGSIMHRSIKDFMIQGGDFTKRNGTGGESIYGGTFADEDLTTPINSEGLLCMANKGPDTNGSQFFITLRECSHLNGKHVVFGKVFRGYEDVVKRLADVPVDEKDRPTIPIVISNCGELELRKPVEKSVSEPSTVKEHRSRRRSKRSSSPGSDHERRRHKKSKRKEVDDNEHDIKGEKPQRETEAEYDARLEREEAERLETERKKILERIKEKYRKESEQKDEVRFKGRGRMKYIDPELSRRYQ